MILLYITITAVLCITQTSAAQTESFDVYTSITSRFAETTITSTVRNDKDVSEEIKFHVLLPREAFISGFSMTIDGKTYEAVVEEKEQARRVFEAARAINKTAGLVATRDRSTKTFRTSVNVEARKTVHFELKYQQLLRRIRGKYRNQIILLGSQLTDYLSIRVDICENQKIKTVEIPPVLDSQGRNVSIGTSIAVQGNTARVDYLQGQNEAAMVALAQSGGSFVVEYELETTPNEGQVVLSNGYLAFFYAPSVVIPPRRIIFTLDLSGSMLGTKLAQLKEAMINIISKLTTQDRFTIVTFASSASVWRNREVMHEATPANIKEAQEFISRMRAFGATNIDEALRISLDILNGDINGSNAVDPSANYIVFLTDGQPTAGVTISSSILNNVDSRNRRRIAIHAVGLGSRVDADFLKALAARNQGTWTQILESINAALQIQNYLDELSVPFLSNLNITYPEEIMNAFVIIHSDSMLAGGEVIALGRLKEGVNPRNRGPFTIQVTDGQNNIVSASARFSLDDSTLGCGSIGGSTVQDFGRKTFALTNVMEILRLYDAERDPIMKETLKQEAINSSIEAGLVTPVTSLLVIKPEDKEDIDEQLAAEITTTAAPTVPTTNAPRNRIIGGSAARQVPPRVAPTTVPRWQLQGDPHFVIQLNDNITACFNWLGKNGEVYNLLHDTGRGIIINGLLGGASLNKPGASHAIFITKIIIILRKEGMIISIDAKEVIIRNTSSKGKSSDDVQLPVEDVKDYITEYGSVTFTITDVTISHTVLNITITEGISFIAYLHHPAHLRPRDIDHIDLMISGSENLSHDIGGIFGQFPRKFSKKESLANIETAGTKNFLWYKDEVSPVTQTSMMVPYLKRRVPCWFVPNPESLMGFSIDSFKMNHIHQKPKANNLRWR